MSSYREDFSICKFQIVCTEFCHTKHVVIGMHRIILNPVSYQFQNSAPCKRMIIYFFLSFKDHRMMRNDHVCSCRNCFIQRFLRKIQCQKHMMHLRFIITDQEAYIVPVFCHISRITTIKPVCQFLYLHISVKQPKSTAFPPLLHPGVSLRPLLLHFSIVRKFLL